MMYRGLTRRAWRIVSIEAEAEARRTGAGELLPEHIVMAVLKDGGGTACKALARLAIDLAAFAFDLEKSLPAPSPGPAGAEIPPSARSRVLLDTAHREAKLAGNEYLGTEHLLLAAVKEAGSPAEVYLRERGVSAESFSAEVLDFRAGEAGFLPADARASLLMSSAGAGALLKPGRGGGPTPALDEFSVDLTALARAGRLDPVIGRNKEMGMALRILARRVKNNPVFVGEPGVGKTAIAEGLARLLSGDGAPEVLAGKRIVSLDLGSVVAGTHYRGEFEERFKRITREITESRDTILFIDEIHNLVGAGQAEGSIDASALLKPALSRGELQCIGATTPAEYRKYFEKDAALERRFQAVPVEEPGYEESLAMLKGIQQKYEDHHGVRYTDGAVEAAARLGRRYITNRCMPDKAIDLLDDAGAMKRLKPPPPPPELSGVEAETRLLLAEKAAMVSSGAFEKAAALKEKAGGLRARLSGMRKEWAASARNERQRVVEDDIRRVISETTGIPLSRLEEEESRRLLNIEAELHRDVVGQDEAVRRVAQAIRRSRVGISSPARPLGSFIFLGPTGVGKTLLAKRLSQYLFDSPDSLVRIDMSDYMEKHNVSRLVGAPPGYVGYEEGGVLTEHIRRNPYRVVLFDEIEKAHRDVFNLLLQVLEEGELKDSLAHTVSFRNTVIIMTSNAGAREISGDSRIGFGGGAGPLKAGEIEASAMSELRQIFNPEFLNRVDDIVVFRALTVKQVEAVLDLQLAALAERLAEQGFTLKVTPPARSFLVQKGWDPKYGGRPMRRAIQKELEDPLSLALLEKEYPPGTVFSAGVKREKIRLSARCG